MYDDINQRLEEARQGMFTFQRLNSKVKELTSQSEVLKEKVDKLKEILAKEDIDVDKLEEKSLAHIFHIILGDLEDQLLKERQEALAAQLKYDQAVKELEQVDAQIHQLVSERIQYKKCEREYNSLMDQKRELLLASDSGTAEQIIQLSQQISQWKNHDKELKEAIRAGKNAIYHLERTEGSLDSAENWGTWDLFGGGLITDMMKHSHLDDAKSAAESVQTALSLFRAELADVQISNNINIETDGFAKFADFFFDGLIADWCMQSRIHASQESVTYTRNQVEKVLDRLKYMERETETQTASLEKQMNELVTRA